MYDFLIMNNLGYPILSILVFLPLLGVIPLIILKNDEIAKYWTLAITTVIALVSLLLYFNFDKTTAQYQFGEHHAWIPMWDINYTLGIAGISLLLVLLTTMILPICILCSWRYITERVRPFSGLHADHGNFHARRFHVPGLCPVLHPLGVDAYSHVPAHRHLGWAPQGVCLN